VDVGSGVRAERMIEILWKYASEEMEKVVS